MEQMEASCSPVRTEETGTHKNEAECDPVLLLSEYNDGDQRQPQSQLASYSDRVTLILKLWRLTSTPEKTEQVVSTGPAALGKNWYHLLLSLLMGRQDTVNVTDFIAAVGGCEAREMQTFLSMLVIIKNVIGLEIDNLVKLSANLDIFPLGMHPFLHTVVAFRYIQLLEVNPDMGPVHRLPGDVLKWQNFILHTAAVTQQDFLDNRANGLTLIQKRKLLDVILDHLLVAAGKDCDNGSSLVLDPSYAPEERLELFNAISLYCYKKLKNAEPLFFLEVIISSLTDTLKTFEKIYYVFDCNGTRLNMGLHDEVTKFYNIQPCTTVIYTNEHAINQVIRFVYMQFITDKAAQPVNLPFNKLLLDMQVMQFENLRIYKQLRGNELPNEFKKITFVNVLKLRMQVEAGIVARSFNEWIDFCNGTNCLNKASASDVIWFLDRQDLKLKELLVYNIVINWSAYQAGMGKQTCKYSAESYKYFLQVRRVLRMRLLLDDMNTVLQHGFISYVDFSIARKNVLKKENDNWWSESGRICYN